MFLSSYLAAISGVTSVISQVIFEALEGIFIMASFIKEDGAHGRIRTATGRILSPLSLPLDYMGTGAVLAYLAALGKDLGMWLELGLFFYFA